MLHDTTWPTNEGNLDSYYVALWPVLWFLMVLGNLQRKWSPMTCTVWRVSYQLYQRRSCHKPKDTFITLPTINHPYTKTYCTNYSHIMAFASDIDFDKWICISFKALHTIITDIITLLQSVTFSARPCQVKDNVWYIPLTSDSPNVQYWSAPS